MGTTGVTARDLASTFREYGETGLQAHATYLLGRAAELEGRVQEAQECYERALDACSDAHARVDTAELGNTVSLSLACLLAHHLHEFARARDMLEKLLEEEDVGLLDGIAQIEVGYCLLHKSDIDGAERAIRLGLQSTRIRNQPIYTATGLQYLGMVFLRLADEGSVTDAVQLLLEAASIARDRPRLLAQVGDTLGRAYSRLGKHQEAIRWLSASLRHKERLRDPLGMATSYGGLGEACMRAGQYTDAISAYQSDLALVRELTPHNLNLVVQLLCLLSEAHRRSGDLDAAEEPLVRARDCTSHLAGDMLDVCLGYIAVYHSRILIGRGRPEEALGRLGDAGAAFQRASYSGFDAAVLQATGQAQLLLEALGDAETCLLRAEELESDPYGLQDTYASLARLYQQRGLDDSYNLYAARTFTLTQLLGDSPPLEVHLPQRTEAGTIPRLRIVDGPGRVAYTNQRMTLRVVVEDSAGRACPGEKIGADAAKLEALGGSLRVVSTRSASDGSITAEISTGTAEGFAQIELSLTKHPVCLQIGFRVWHIDVEVTPSLRIPPHAPALLKGLFHRLTDLVTVDGAVDTGQSDQPLLRVVASCARLRGRSRKLRPVVKLGSIDALAAERNAYNEHLGRLSRETTPTLLATATSEEHAALAYLLPTTRQRSDVASLSNVLLSGDYPQVKACINRLYGALSPLHGMRHATTGRPSTHPLTEEDTADFWRVIHDRLPPGILEMDSEGRVLVESSGAIQSLSGGIIQLYRSMLGSNQRLQEAFTHGELCSHNVLVDSSGHVWVLNWQHAGCGLLFRDFATLELDLRLAPVRQGQLDLDLDSWFDVESGMQERLATPSGPSESLDQEWRFGCSGTAALDRAYFAVYNLRLTALQYFVQSNPLEYLQILFCHTVESLVRVQDPRETKVLLAMALSLSQSISGDEAAD